MIKKKKNSHEQYLEHHGVKGMKWGVRRYQNYDGSYTKKGLEHYRQSEAEYDKANEVYKATKKIYKDTKKKGYYEDSDGQRIAIRDKNVVKEAKNERKIAKQHMSKDYDQLKKDKLADKGKALYQSGKTITGSANALGMATTIATGTAAVAGYLASEGKKKPAMYVGAAGIGLEFINGVVGIKNELDARKLRAYYSHNRAYRDW